MPAVWLRGYEMLAALIPALCTFLLFKKSYRHRGIKLTWGRLLLLGAWVLYLLAVFHLTSVGTWADICSYRLEIKPNQINLAPFSHTIDWTAYIQNLLLFVPWGVLLPLLATPFKKIVPLLMSGMAFSLLIEASQLLNNRRTDVDDLILNTAGALLGFLIYKIISLVVKSDNLSATYYKYEPWVYLAVMFLGRFCLFYEMKIAQFLYNF